MLAVSWHIYAVYGVDQIQPGTGSGIGYGQAKGKWDKSKYGSEQYHWRSGVVSGKVQIYEQQDRHVDKVGNLKHAG